ncbi:MAG TPA: polyprenyl synthetase family protein [Luteibaculaceae bacterium]|nr:polyprenyl synthetase family protein [Luteibaculaceae bacterium]
MITYPELLDEIEKQLTEINLSGQPNNLYEPMRYLLGIGGKRIRPYALLLSNKCFGGQVKQAMPAALAIEVFHNFTLMHDDIMDKAPLRRGHTTVHEKWSTTVAILSGDAMMVKAYQLLEGLPDAHFKSVYAQFNQTAIEVCEGQQFDMDFELRNDVLLTEYVEMIRCKTAVLLATSLKLGALLANASERDQELIYQFGENLGIAFQIQDDYLDCYGNAHQFGKQLAGDILDRKKTFLLLHMMQYASDEIKQRVVEAWKSDRISDQELIELTLSAYASAQTPESTLNTVEHYTMNALLALDQVSISLEEKQPLFDLANGLMVRQS